MTDEAVDLADPSRFWSLQLIFAPVDHQYLFAISTLGQIIRQG